jgi:uncharacterized membrane protein YidH (DUF202 family)
MKYFYTLTLLAFPALASAQSVFSLLELVSDLVEATVPVIIGLAVLVFVFGILKYVVAKSPEDQKEARGVILWGIIILFVMVSIWGLVNLLGSTLQLNQSAPPAPITPGI